MYKVQPIFLFVILMLMGTILACAGIPVDDSNDDAEESSPTLALEEIPPTELITPTEEIAAELVLTPTLEATVVEEGNTETATETTNSGVDTVGQVVAVGWEGAYAVNTDGSDLFLLGDEEAVGFSPVWSPDGTQIAFTSNVWYSDTQVNFEIFLVDADGSNQIQLTNSEEKEQCLSWSPDGSQIAFVSDHTGDNRGYVLDISSGSIENIIPMKLELENTYYDCLVWSPDGTQIVFYSGNFYTGDSKQSSVYLINASGGEAVNLTGGQISGMNPAWSPDGSQIAFWSPLTENIHLINVDGSGLRDLTTGGTAPWFFWSPDGNRIVFSDAFSDIDHAGIYTVDIPDDPAEDGSVILLTDFAGLMPAWSSDGRQIGFTAFDGINEGIGIYIMNADGSEIMRVGEAIWSGEGNIIGRLRWRPMP